MYLIIIERNNGYHCSCCQNTWTITEERETLEEVKKLVAEYPYGKDKYGDETTSVKVYEAKEVTYDI